MDPLLFTTYLASVVIGPATIAYLTAAGFIHGRESDVGVKEALYSSAVLGFVSVPSLRKYSQVSRNLEKRVLKQPKLKLCAETGRFTAVPHKVARKAALEAAAPVWMYGYCFPCLTWAIATPNDYQRVILSIIGAACGVLATACRLQNALEPKKSGSEYGSGELEHPEKPEVVYFKNAAKVDGYSADVQNILENRKQHKNAPAGNNNGGVFSWLKTGKQQRKPEKHGNMRVLLSGMK